MENIKWRPEVVGFLKQKGIDEDVMRPHVRSIRSYEDHGRSFNDAYAPILAYNYSEDGTFKSFKRCMPLNKKWKWFWQNKQEAIGHFPYDVLHDEGEALFLVGGEKDVLMMMTHGYKAICISGSETSHLTDELHRDMKRKYQRLYVMYDNDSTGVKNANHISTQFQIPMVNLPPTINGKTYGTDVSDLFYFKQEGFDALKALQAAIQDCDESENGGIVGPKVIRESTDVMMTELMRISKEVRELKAGRVDFPPPILTMGTNYNHGFLFPYTITVVQGQSGVHKSRFAEVVASLFLSGPDHPYPEVFLGMEKKEQPYHVVYVDTERNIRHQLPYAIQSIQERAGIPREIDPDNFDYITLMHEDRNKRFGILARYLKEIREERKGFLIVVLDVITDCVSSFNDLAESNKLIDMINIMVNDEECSIICVIHENPGKEQKARGHLGTEIANKASTQFKVGWNNDEGEDGKREGHVKIEFEKNRMGMNLDPIHVSFDRDLGGLIESDKLGRYTRDNIKEMLDGVRKEEATNISATHKEEEIVEALAPDLSFETPSIMDGPALQLPPEPEGLKGKKVDVDAVLAKNPSKTDHAPLGQELEDDDLPF